MSNGCPGIDCNTVIGVFGVSPSSASLCADRLLAKISTSITVWPAWMLLRGRVSVDVIRVIPKYLLGFVFSWCQWLAEP
jgi:hypothetical protein